MHQLHLLVYFFLIFSFAQSNPDSMMNLYYRLASSYCYIDDYPAWLQQQSLLNYFLEFARYIQIDNHYIEQMLEQYRLQHQCLRALERLPILVGNG